MTAPPQIRISLRPLDHTATDGAYHFLADDRVVALARWNGDAFAYPGGSPIEFTPRYSRPAGLVLRRADEVAP